MFRVKICGITSRDDARAVVKAGADAVGLNFYPKSPRYVTLEKARRIADVLPQELIKVGLFVNAAAEEVCRTFDRLDLDLIQLHGDEPPAFLAELGDRPVIRAFRVGPDGLRPACEYLRRCRELGCLPRLLLVDAYVKGAYGGTGSVADWDALQKIPPGETFPPMVLAGGLTPHNVAEAIRTVRPAAVDTASGVESSPGKKDPAAVEAFVQAARAAFKNVGQGSP
ncbi:MAG TPA: phosphoribosylanthranilate isomerase [Thermoguttaceae bacterium]|nr:phosphoribosylanthranilate isomerase [Thermoguttaceae bacterium]